MWAAWWVGVRGGGKRGRRGRMFWRLMAVIVLVREAEGMGVGMEWGGERGRGAGVRKMRMIESGGRFVAGFATMLWCSI